jgi:hypothetical protein
MPRFKATHLCANALKVGFLGAKIVCPSLDFKVPDRLALAAEAEHA